MSSKKKTITAMENVPVKEQPASVRRQYVLVEASLSSGNTRCTNKLSITEAFTRWNTAEGGYGRLHMCPMCKIFHTTDHKILGVFIYVYIGVADSKLFDPRVCDDIHYYTGHATNICPW